MEGFGTQSVLLPDLSVQPGVTEALRRRRWHAIVEVLLPGGRQPGRDVALVAGLERSLAGRAPIIELTNDSVVVSYSTSGAGDHDRSQLQDLTSAVARVIRAHGDAVTLSEIGIWDSAEIDDVLLPADQPMPYAGERA